MSCPAENQLVDFAEGRLDETARGQIDSHLDGCRSCRVVVAGLTSAPSHATPSALDSTIASPVSGPRSPAGEQLRPGAKLGRYQVIRFLGAGAMGEVYLADDASLARRVALKVLRLAPGRDSSDLRARLVREAQAMGRLNHPNVVTVYEVSDEGGQVFIAMEFIDGEPLRRWLRSAPSWREVVRAFVDAGTGLHAAHQRGLVHRDFKPDNVLIGTDGRVRVSDFGLAADLDDAAVAPAGEVTTALGVRLTQTGALVGTPAYMALELLERRAGSPASDQFSFCMALAEALGGQRPMDGDSLPSLIEARRQGPAFPTKSEVPAAVWAVLRRGLAVEPASRYPSMQPLLDDLSRLVQPKRWSRGALVAATLAVGAAVTAGVVATRAPSCEVSDDALAGVWDAQRQSAVEAALRATKVPFVETTLDRVRRTLDERAKAWRSARKDACEATWVARTQSEQLLDLRMRCLDRARDELGAVTASLAEADEATATSATKVLASLSPLSWCADARLLSASVPPPPVAAEAEVTSVRRALASARVLIASKPAAAVGTIGAQVERARVTGYAPLRAAALADLAEAQLAAGDAKTAEVTAREAVTLADGAGDDFDRARALLALLDAVSEQARWPEGATLAKDATAVIQRLGGDAELSSVLALRQGKLEYKQSHYDEAIAHDRRALELREQLHGPDDARVAEVLQLLAIAIGSTGKLDEAKQMYERALAIREASLGPTHPDVAATLNTLGIDASDRGDFQLALQRFGRALEIRVAALGPDHVLVGHVLTNMAGTHLALDDAKTALDEIRRAIAIETTALGADHPSLAECWQVQCEAHAALGEAKEADAACQHALDLTLAKRAPTHVRVGLTHLSWGEARLLLSDPRGALEHFQRARAPIAGRVGETDLYFVQLDVAEAEALTALKRAPDAAPNLERALKALTVNGTLSPDLVTRIHLAVARQRIAAKAEDAPVTLALARAAATAHPSKRATEFLRWADSLPPSPRHH